MKQFRLYWFNFGIVSMIIDVTSYLHYIYVVCHVVFTLCPYFNDIALVLWLYWICIFSCKWYNVVTIWLQTLVLYWFYIAFMLSICCIYVVLIYFQHRICIACALLNIGDVMLQQHSYKLDIQYWMKPSWYCLHAISSSQRQLMSFRHYS